MFKFFLEPGKGYVFKPVDRPYMAKVVPISYIRSVPFHHHIDPAG